MAGRIKKKRDYSKYVKPISFRPDRDILRKFKKILELMVSENNQVTQSMVISRAVNLLYENMVKPELRKRLLERELTQMAKMNALRQRQLQSLIQEIEDGLKNRV